MTAPGPVPASAVAEAGTGVCRAGSRPLPTAGRPAFDGNHVGHPCRVVAREPSRGAEDTGGDTVLRPTARRHHP
ncbi:hypothetical protein STRAU_5082 [Streptomyces aurantiacus JA 4570]|uniref:Uncharacterized protein n=1 Tax=Streptomyces aurantiacus JA 4570 TaxID=1286094 RepID=S3ZTR3_9ACTN|nr:hypothetical protein STRAU_5082 [Streptomyces aurantiacus JA 4570]